MSRVYRHPCGCRSTDSAWVEMCAACGAEFQERHQHARAEHVERQAAPYVISNPQITLSKRGRELLEQAGGQAMLVDEVQP